MSFADFVERHARTIVVVALALAIAGGVSGLSLPVGLFPQTAFPRVVVNLDAGSRPADQMALLVTRPVEQAIRTVPGVLDVRSDTTRGSAQVSIDFGWGRDMTASTLLVDAAIAQVLPSLPTGTGYDVRRMDPTVFPIISYALLPPVPKDGSPASGAASAVALRDLAQYQIQPLLASIPGLARVDVQGGETAEVEVLADPHRLATYGLGMADLATALTAGNVLQAVGRMEDHDKLYLVLADRTLTRADDVAGASSSAVMPTASSASVTSPPCRTASCRNTSAWSRTGARRCCSTSTSSPTATRSRSPRPSAPSSPASTLPPGVKLLNWYDQSELVTQSAGSVRDAVLIGLVLAAAVLMLFLRSWRVTLIAILVVPATLATSVLLLSLLGMSFNIMTLGGIAAAVGLLIDDVIVMVEHIARRAGAEGPGRRGGTGRGAAGSARVHAAADRVEPGDVDRVSCRSASLAA